ncbi:MAG TPA: phosphoribosyltransferase family protein [Clostridia bacterium]|nr:phosphoribosyltransferase family protein [Clostridia bacterium]
MNSFFQKLLDVIYPKGLTCISCENELGDKEREYSLCAKCFANLKKVEDDIKLGNGITVHSCFHYDDVARQLVLSYKDSDKPYISEYMAKFIKDKYIDKEINADGIVFVPSNVKKINKRGYDALKQVAIHLSKMINIPVFYGLEKKIIGVDLTQVAKEKRAEQVKDSFYIKDDACLKGKKVLLIDDVITTGATLNECIHTLNDGKIEKIYVITFTRALH